MTPNKIENNLKLIKKCYHYLVQKEEDFYPTENYTEFLKKSGCTYCEGKDKTCQEYLVLPEKMYLNLRETRINLE